MQNIRKSNCLKILFLVVISLYSALYLELFYESNHETSHLSTLLHGYFLTEFGSLVRLFFFFFLLFVSFVLLAKILSKSKLSNTIFRFRYVIGFLIFFILVICQISGSSISYWANIFNYQDNTGLLFGEARSIRSDEWLVFTPFSLSQSSTDYSGISDLIRAASTDVTMVYAQPSWSIATFFRPFLWGYLFFGSSFGLSFFWCTRLLALFFSSFECARIYTNDNRILSLTVAILITFAPIIQWWFAVNGTAELFIFGQLLVICLWQCLRKGNHSVVFAALIPWLSGCFLFIMYPAWQVPLFYVFAAMGIGLFVQNKKANTLSQKKRLKHNNKALIGFFTSLVIVIAAMALSISSSWETIQIVSNTAYPGERFETGGGLATQLFNYGSSVYSAISSVGVEPNVCEQAAFYSLAPLGIVLSSLVLFKKRDPLLVALLLVQAFFLIYGLLGLPAILSKLTLLSNVPTYRLIMAIGFIDIVVLARALTLIKKTDLSKTVLISSVALSCCVGLVLCELAPSIDLERTKGFLVVASFVFAFMAIYTFLQNKKGNGYPLLAFSIAIVGISGFCVNPIQQGSSFLNEIPEIKQIQIINEQEQGIWVGDRSIEGQACILAGAPSINSVNIYPNNELWQLIDPSGENKDIYNRYAHITIKLKDEGPAEFTLNHADAFTVTLTIADLKKLGVNYFFTAKDYSDLVQTDSQMTLISQIGNYRYYKL